MDELMRLQLEMTSLGWDVETKISNEGWGDSVGYSIWFRRGDWHGKLTYTIIGDDVVFMGTYANAADYNGVLRMVKRIVERAKKAWNDFPDSIPCQNVKGEVKQAVMIRPFYEGKDV
jgi:hypothetical protein